MSSIERHDPEAHDPEKHPEQSAIREGRNIALGKVEAFNKVLNQSGQPGKVLRGIIVVSIGLTMFTYALGQGITPQFDVMATSVVRPTRANWSSQYGESDHQRSIQAIYRQDCGYHISADSIFGGSVGV
ncbi:uncharacterized protein ACHE_60463S [Aspergillus chevalieri]|uniref:Uncharacterized protein n=1 Tax=Aspergillus chevalieri TaxID=182096 RepID=A0A7R7VTQ1_ASPCH|nr:uncharacterized protein ACHE_60463S [Aspergillus chevalieri]BCR90577.1 hypothetical protein ACHE_60463S [Aspergillus chevalieri]